jgi:hypothetical protein
VIASPNIVTRSKESVPIPTANKPIVKEDPSSHSPPTAASGNHLDNEEPEEPFTKPRNRSKKKKKKAALPVTQRADSTEQHLVSTTADDQPDKALKKRNKKNKNKDAVAQPTQVGDPDGDNGSAKKTKKKRAPKKKQEIVVDDLKPTDRGSAMDERASEPTTTADDKAPTSTRSTTEQHTLSSELLDSKKPKAKKPRNKNKHKNKEDAKPSIQPAPLENGETTFRDHPKAVDAADPNLAQRTASMPSFSLPRRRQLADLPLEEIEFGDLTLPPPPAFHQQPTPRSLSVSTKKLDNASMPRRDRKKKLTTGPVLDPALSLSNYFVPATKQQQPQEDSPDSSKKSVMDPALSLKNHFVPATNPPAHHHQPKDSHQPKDTHQPNDSHQPKNSHQHKDIHQHKDSHAKDQVPLEQGVDEATRKAEAKKAKKRK